MHEKSHKVMHVYTFMNPHFSTKTYFAATPYRRPSIAHISVSCIYYCVRNNVYE